MLNFIQRWHRKTVHKIAAKLGLPEDMSHHHRTHAKHPYIKNVRVSHQRSNIRIENWHQRHHQGVTDWHAQHAVKVMAGTSRLHKWERFVYKQISRVVK